ncbi:MAG: serine hydrolase, partial [Leadbetterella sp.]|nr:serine hydrolase [Leadbetterella sp.]
LNRRGFNAKGEPCANVSHYGYGLRLDRNCDNISMLGHSGGLPGYGSDWKILPQYGLGIVTLTNGTYGSAALLNNEILPYVVAKAALTPKAFPVSVVLKQRQKELAALLPSWEKAEGSGIFAENFFSDYFTDLLKEEAEAAFAKAGRIRKMHEIVAENALRGSFIMEGEKANLRVHFTLSPENPPLIQAYGIRVE